MDYCHVYYRIKLNISDRKALHDEAYALLDKLLRDKLGEGLDSYGKIKTNDNSKPYFDCPDAPHFNISHTKGGIIAGIASSEIGVDIEHTRRVTPALYNKCYSESDRTFVNKDNPDAISLIPWTYKEAYLKALGTGIKGTAMLRGIDMPSGHSDPDFSFNYFTDSNFAGCVYVTSRIPIEITRI